MDAKRAQRKRRVIQWEKLCRVLHEQFRPVFLRFKTNVHLRIGHARRHYNRTLIPLFYDSQVCLGGHDRLCDAIFSHWITRCFRCARLASIFGIPEVEFESGFTMPRFVRGGDAHFRCDAVKTDVDIFLCVVFFRMLYVEC